MSIRDLIILGSSSQQPTRFRNHSGYLFRWNDEGLLFDPGEGTQRQFIFAEVAPTCVTRIFVSHFHGDHCLGLGSMLMRLNLDKVQHPIHCYYPASGKKYFDRLRYGTIYHETITVIEHPVERPLNKDTPIVVHKDDNFTIEAVFLEHGIDNIGWRIQEHNFRKFDREKLALHHVAGPLVTELSEKEELVIEGKKVTLDDVSVVKEGEKIAIVIDTRPCPQIVTIAQGARILLMESTYLSRDDQLARDHFHLTAKDAATLALKAHVEKLILTHFSARYTNIKEIEDEARAIFPESYVAEDFKRFPFPKKK